MISRNWATNGHTDGFSRDRRPPMKSLNGLIVPLVDLGATYTVNPDCTGSIAVDLGGGQTINFNFIIVDRGKELRSIQTDPNTAITGNLRQQ